MFEGTVCRHGVCILESSLSSVLAGFSKEGNVYLDNLAVEAKDSEKMALDNIPGEIVDDNDLCIGL